MRLEILKLQQLLSDLPDRLSWKQTWDVRMKVGNLIVGATPESRLIIKDVYDKFTMQLKARAEELGKADDFAEADRLAQLGFDSAQFRADLNAATDSVQFFDILNDPSRQKELEATKALIEVGGVPAETLDRVRDSVKASHQISKRAKEGKRIRLWDRLGFLVELLRYPKRKA